LEIVWKIAVARLPHMGGGGVRDSICVKISMMTFGNRWTSICMQDASEASISAWRWSPDTGTNFEIMGLGGEWHCSETERSHKCSSQEIPPIER